MCRRYVYKYGTEDNPERKHYNRFRRGEFGSSDRALTTRYTYEMGLRPCVGPRGGKAYREFPRTVYYAGGTFWHHVTKAGHDEGTYRDAYEPVTGVVWDACPQQSRNAGMPISSIECRNGVPRFVTIDGEQFEADDTNWPMMEQFLGLDKRPRKSPCKTA